MNILVTGGSGFIGSHVVRRLLADGHRVYATATAGENPLPNGVRDLGRCFHDLPWHNTAMHAIEAVIHLAAETDPTRTGPIVMQVNMTDACNLFYGAEWAGCRRFVYASSAAVYGKFSEPIDEDGPVGPLTDYAMSKHRLERWADAWLRPRPDTTAVGLRFANVYGPGEAHKGKSASMIRQLILQMKAGDQAPYGNPTLFSPGTQARDWVHVDDVADAVVKALDCQHSGVVNIGTGVATSFNRLVEIGWSAVAGARFVFGQPATKYINNPHPDRYQDYTALICDRAREWLDWEPKIGVEEGIRLYVKELIG